MNNFDDLQRFDEVRRPHPSRSVPSSQAPNPTTRSLLVGRTVEMRLLEERLTEAQLGRGGLVLLAGEPGIGKTRLGAEAADRAGRAGMTVLWGRCREGGGAPPYLPWVQILQGMIEATSTAQGDRRLGWADVAALIDPNPRSVSPPDPSDRFRLFASLAAMLSHGAAPNGLLAVLDDLHRADEASLAFLRYLVPELAQLPILVVGTYRDGEMHGDHPLAATIGAIADVATVPVVRLEGLDRAEVKTLLDRHIGPVDGDVAETVATRTSGNPLFVIEIGGLLRTTHGDRRRVAAGAIPHTVREVINWRVGRLPIETSRALRAAAVVGREFGRLPLADVLGTSELAVISALEPAAKVHLVSARPAGSYGFSHGLVQEVLYEAIGIGERTELHRRAAAAIAALDATDDESVSDLAFHSYHAALGRDPRPALGHALAAGRRAHQHLAFEEAARWLTLALELAERGRERDDDHLPLLFEAAEADVRAGLSASARARFERAADIARGRQDGRSLTRAALGAGSTVVSAGKVDWDLVALLEEAVAAAIDDADRARLQSRLAIELYWYQGAGPSRAQSLLALETAERSGDEEVVAIALHARQFTLRSPEHLEERVDIGERLVALAERRNHVELTFQGTLWLAAEVLRTANFPKFRDLVGSLRATATRSRLPRQRWYAAVMEASLAAMEGRIEDALVVVEEAAALGRSLGMEHTAAFRLTQLCVVCREREGLASLAPVIDSVASELPYYATLRALAALAAATTGHGDAAAWEIDRLSGNAFAVVPRDSLWVATIALLTEAAAISGSPHTAQLVDLLSPHRGTLVVQGIPGCWGSVDRFLGRAHLALGQEKDADRDLSHAWEMESRIGAPLFLARTNLDRARLAMLRNRRDEARRLAAEVNSTANRLGLTALAAEMSEVIQLGAEQGRSTFPLSRREGQVLTLVTTGASNKEIAAKLFISLNTVERHLSNIYTKLGVRGRADAAAYAVATGLATGSRNGGSP